MRRPAALVLAAVFVWSVNSVASQVVTNNVASPTTSTPGQCGSPMQVLQQQTGINLQLFLGFLRTANLTAAFMDSTAAATIFVPTDEAIRSGLTQQGMQLQTVQQNTNLLRDIIFYHVVPVTQGGSRLAAAQLTNGLTLQSSLTSPQVLTCGERTLRIINQGGVRVQGGTGTSGSLVRPDLQSCTAFIHIIDGLVLPCPLNTPTQRATNQTVTNTQMTNRTSTGQTSTSQSVSNRGNVTNAINRRLSPSPAAVVAQPVVQPIRSPTAQPAGVIAGQSVRQPVVGQSTVGQPIVGQPIVGQPLVGQPIPGQPIPGQPIAGQPIAGQAGAFQLTFGDAVSSSNAVSNGVAEAQSDATGPGGAFADAFSQGGQAARSVSRANGGQRAFARSAANALG